MAENFNDDIEALREALRKQREVTEDDILAREGYARNQNGLITKLESAAKRRANLEEEVNRKLEAAFGKEQVLINKKIVAQERQQTELEKQNKIFAQLSNKYQNTNQLLGDFSSNILETSKSSKALTATYQITGAAIEGMYKATVSMAKSLYAGERGATVTAKAFSELTDSVGSVIQGLGAALFFLGPVGKLAKVAGLGLTALGAGIKTYGEYQKLGAEQNKKLFETYNKLSASGLAASKGLTGVFETVQTLGMTASEIEKFTELLVNNSKELKLFGATAAEGAKRYTEVAGDLVKSEIGQKLELMGITADEQREHTLRYMANQTRMGMIEGKTRQDLIRGSQSYIQELDKISMLTGATRKEQEEARAAVMAEENLRAAMLQAELDGDKKRQQELKSIADYATYLRATGDTRGATGVANYGALGGPMDDASAAAMITYGKGIEAALQGKPIAEVIKEGQKSADQTLKQMAATRTAGGDVSGLVTGKYGNMLDTSKMNAEVIKAIGPNGDINAYLTELQKQREKADAKLNATVEGNRKQQDAAMMMDSVVFSKFNHAAQIQQAASNVFNNAVKLFSETVGAKPVTGGGYSNVSGGGGSSSIPRAPNAPPNAGATQMGGMAEQRLRGLGGASQGAPSALPSNLQSASTSGMTSYLQKIAQVESGGMAGAKAKTSSASGLFQFTEGTWKETTKAMGKNYSLDDRFDPQKSAEVARYFTTQQKARLEKGTGKSANDTDLYMAHFLGAGGATKFLNSMANDPNALASAGADMSQIEANKSIFYENGGNGKMRTLKQVYDLMAGKLDRSAQTISAGKGGADLAMIQQGRFGGIFSGSSAGYPVMLHGNEMVIPMPDASSLDVSKTELSQSSISNSTNNISNNTDSTEVIYSMIDILSEKLDAMIDKLSTGNDISDKLLRNSMV